MLCARLYSAGPTAFGYTFTSRLSLIRHRSNLLTFRFWAPRKMTTLSAVEAVTRRAVTVTGLDRGDRVTLRGFRDRRDHTSDTRTLAECSRFTINV